MQKTNALIVYVASILFYGERFVNHYPSMSTEYSHTMESFMDYCELAARQDEQFSVCDVYINCAKTQIFEDGSVLKIDSQLRKFLNAKRA
jgi:hypothetical protein